MCALHEHVCTCVIVPGGRGSCVALSAGEVSHLLPAVWGEVLSRLLPPAGRSTGEDKESSGAHQGLSFQCEATVRWNWRGGNCDGREGRGGGGV